LSKVILITLLCLFQIGYLTAQPCQEALKHHKIIFERATDGIRDSLFYDDLRQNIKELHDCADENGFTETLLFALIHSYLVEFKGSPTKTIEKYHLLQKKLPTNFSYFNGMIEYHLGDIYASMGQVDLAIEHYQNVMQYIEKKEINANEFGYLFIDLGNLFFKNKQYEIANKYYDYYLKEQANLFSKEDMEYAVAVAYNNKGLIYFEKEAYDSALHWFNKGLESRKQLGVLWPIVHSYGYIGSTYLELEKYDSARYYFQLSVEKCKEFDYNEIYVSSLINYGKYYDRLSKSDSAKFYYHEALNASKKSDLRKQEADLCLKLGQLHNKQNRTDSAELYFNLSWEIADKIENVDFKKSSAKELCQLYEKNSEFEKLSLFQGHLINILNREIDQGLENYQGIIEINERERIEYEQSIKEEENNKRLAVLIIALSFLILLAIILTIGYRKVHKQKKKIHEQKNLLGRVVKIKNTLTDTIVHDLKNAINILYAKLNLVTDDDIRRNIDSQVKQMQTLILNILDVARSEEYKLIPNKKNILLSEITSQVIEMLKLIAQTKNVQIIEEHKTNVYLEVDKLMIDRVITNLLLNAVKYSKNNGTIRFESYAEGDILYFSVTDFGPGIAEYELENIFEPYYRGKQNNVHSASYGLGLSFCKIALHAHDGDISVSSIKNTNTTFTCTLPIYKISNSGFSNSKVQDQIISLNNSDIFYLRKFSQRLNNLEIYKLSEIQEVIQEMENKSTAIKNWKEDFVNAVGQHNQEKYDKLIKIISNE